MKNKKIYTGFTTNLKERIGQHEQGEVKSTRNFRPLLLIHCEAYFLESDASRREKFLKSSDGKLFLRRQLTDLYKKIGRYEDYKNIFN